MVFQSYVHNIIIIIIIITTFLQNLKLPGGGLVTVASIIIVPNYVLNILRPIYIYIYI